MNERINQFILDAGFVHYGEDMGSYNIPVPAFKQRMEKFAELIVKECINALDEVDGSIHHSECLLEHFGVEE